eukprot:CCRYP_000215-RA/>CCRYP_000215-RA protein AED:0.04 eAED:0.04 QI:74/1/1/1/1/1/2/341/299
MPMFVKPLALSFIIVIVAIIARHVTTYKDIYTAEELRQKYGPTAVVIGASEGLGAAWADLLCRNGLEVVTIARRSAELEERKRELESKYRCKVSTVTLDLASDDVTPTMQSIFDTHSIGLVIYNAAVFGLGTFTSSLELQLTGIRVNAESLTRTAHAFASATGTQGRKSSGLIIMSSTLGDTGGAYIATYGATKAYNTILAQGLAAEWKSNGIDVLACVAGPISTPNFFRANNDTSGMDFMIQTPNEVAEECLQALGQDKYAIATGAIQKVMRFVTAMMPARFIVDSWKGFIERNLPEE